jgi:peptidoglycan hydrolase CwlO-like protein
MIWLARIGILIICGYLILFSPIAGYVSSSTPEQKLEEIKRKIEETQKLLESTRAKKATLQNEIAYQDNQIRLTSLKIEETEEQISTLTSQITKLEVALSDLSHVFAKRVVETYKLKRMADPAILLFSSSSVSEFISRFYYLAYIAQNDRNVLLAMQTAQSNYEDQKEKVENLRARLEKQKQTLAAQKAQKQYLLEITKNDEKRFQQLLAQARAELEAIQAIIAGRGTETEVGKVTEGQRIATLIAGPSCNSSGKHLHFIVSKDGKTENPFNFLKAGIDYVNCSGSGSCSEGDPFNPQGSWNWPISPRIRFLQGYGLTWAVQNTWVGKIYNFHNGIDIDSESSDEVKAVKSGTLYRGSYSGSGGCQLRYVRVHHDDSGLDTFYLHINY